MRAVPPVLFAAILAHASAFAFDAAAWQAKRADLSNEVVRLAADYRACAKEGAAPAEDVALPIETFPNGSVKTSVQAKKARYFLDSGLVWAEGVRVVRRREGGEVDLSLEAADCVVDRLTKSGWADGAVSLAQAGTACRGRGVYFSSPEGFVRITRDADFESRDVRTKGVLASDANAPLRIRARSCDIDRDAGVVCFEGGVRVEHAETTMRADRVFAFLAASNQLSRVVADGSIVITNGLRVGTCAMATYRRARGELEMFGAAGGAKARLAESGERSSELTGDRIRFWIGSEQVEVVNAALATEHEGKKEDFL